MQEGTVLTISEKSHGSYSQNAAGSQILKKPKSEELEQKNKNHWDFGFQKNIIPSIGVYVVPSSYILVFNFKITFSPTFEQRWIE